MQSRFTPFWASIRSAWPLALFLMIAFAIYGSALGNGFVLDDETQIVGNPEIQDWHRIPSLFTASTNKVTGAKRLAGIYYKPVMTSAYAALWAVDGASGWVFHGAEVALHALNAFLIFLLFCRLFERPIAGFLALIFLIHPANSEVAIYSADLQDALYFFFGAAALLVASRPSAAWSWGRRTALAMLLLLSLLSKESGVLFVFAALAWVGLGVPTLAGAALPASSRQSERAAKRKQNKNSGTARAREPSRASAASGAPFAAATRAPFFAACGAAAAALGAYAVLRFGVAGLYATVGQSWARMGHSSLGERLLSAPLILLHYARIFVYPVDLTTTQDWMVRRPTFAEFWAPLAAVACALAAAAIAWRRLKPGRAAPFFALALAAGLGIHLQIHPLDGTVADRWLYMPAFAALGLLGLALQPALRAIGARPPLRWTAASLACAAGLWFAWLSHERSLDWHDGMTLYAHDVALDPDNGLLQNNLGVELFRAGNKAEALKRFQAAAQLSPYWNIPWNNLGATQEAFGQWSDAEASYHASIERGLYDLAYENYPRLLLHVGKADDARAFIERVGLPALPTNPTLLALKAQLDGAR